VGPDNGIFTAVFEKENNNFFKVLHLNSSHYFLPTTGATFHGRDIFAPVAAWLSKGVDSLKFGEQISDYIKIAFPERHCQAIIAFTVKWFHFDHYGNASQTSQQIPCPVSANRFKT